MSENTEALLGKAAAEHLAGRTRAASALYARVLRQSPLDFRALHLGGAAAYQLEQMELAASLFQRAIRIKPGSGSTLVCLGLVYAELGRPEEAEQHLKAGLALDSANPEAWLNLGGFLVTTGRSEEAKSCYKRALQLRPAYPAALVGLGEALKSEGHAALATSHYALALKLDPKNAVARLGLVQTLQSCNRATESLQECDRLLAEQPGHIRARSSRLFLLNYTEEVPAARMLEEHLAYGRLFPAAPPRRFPNARNPDKKLRIAFLSPDLRGHSVAFFLEPLIAHLDPSAFEILLYHDHVRTDEVSKRLASRAAVWRNFCGRGDGLVEATIRSDAPDVLVDLAGHSGQNRLHLFARRLAPVQVAYLGYPNTTGLTAMDYRLTDEIADPEGTADRQHTERLVRFSRCAWTYAPSSDVEAAGQVPAAGQGDGIAFGSFNNLCKASDATLRLWAAVLAAAPGSRLVLKAFGIEPERTGRRLAQAGIDSSRTSLLLPTQDIASHLACYRHLDVALDTFPYGGTTTTCEALWMGRPLVTLAGERHASRVGASILHAIGRPEWVARTPEEFARIAADLAADRVGLGRESQGLRARLKASAIFDHRAQAERFGHALRACWRRWCEPDRPQDQQGADASGEPIAELARA